MNQAEQVMPAVLRELHTLEFHYADGEGIDFGQDGSGGYVAFWLIRLGEDLLRQPIVYFGSEGEIGVVAANFSDYLWLLAGGIGPVEAIDSPAAEY